MEKVDRTVVRNQSYQKNGIGIRERHNERKNEHYSNDDIQPERSHMNVHFLKCESTYTQAFERMLEDGTLSTRGLKPDAKVFGELVFDVNSAYFENHGGYEYAKRFFEEAYHFAEKEIGSPYILSAVMHADERNSSLSAELGRDVYHYHLHVTYIPVVDKEIKWTARCKDKSLVGTTREIIHQVSNSKKWAFVPMPDELGNQVYSKSGKPKMIPSYSILQDKFFNHMTAAGYTDVERGVRGSTDENLSVLDFKIKKDSEKLAVIENKITEQKTECQELSHKIKSATKTHADLCSVDGIGKKKMFGKIELTEKEYADLTSLAKEGIASRGIIENLKSQLQSLRSKYWTLNEQFDKLYDATREFREAMKLAPQKIKEFFTEIFRKAKEEKEEKRLHKPKRTSGRDAR